jgi:hypothetical protein
MAEISEIGRLALLPGAATARLRPQAPEWLDGLLLASFAVSICCLCFSGSAAEGGWDPGDGEMFSIWGY